MMKQNGFTLYRRCFYLVKNDVAYCIEFESPTNLIYAWFYIVPLYVPYEERAFSFGNRFSSVPKFNLRPLNRNLPESEAVMWCENFQKCLTEYIFPFFHSISSPQKILEFLERPDGKRYAYFRCDELFILRLQMFSVLFLEKTTQAQKMMTKYKKAINKSTSLMPAVLDSLLKEASTVEKLFLCSPLMLKPFFEKNIETTLYNCFNVRTQGT